MGHSIAAFYTPDDGLEHAVRVFKGTPEIAGDPSLLHIDDFTFSPSTHGHIAPIDEYPPEGMLAIIAGTYCPIDNYRYYFYATEAKNALFWVGYAGDYLHVHHPPMTAWTTGELHEPFNLSSYAPGSITDLAAFYSSVDNQIVLLVLMSDGTIWRGVGRPWAKEEWQLLPFLTRIDGARSITGFDGAGSNHAIIGTDLEITELWFNQAHVGQNQIWTFDRPKSAPGLRTILDIGSFFTSEDGFAHVIVAASSEVLGQTDVHEITFVPAKEPPSIRQLGRTAFIIESLGAYTKPDKGRHVIMLRQYTDGPPLQLLYLSWYYPGWTGFQYGPWPPLQTW